MAQSTPSGQPNPMQAGEFTPTARANAISFQLDKVPPPSNLYLQRDDTILVMAVSDLAGEIVTLAWRLLETNGVIQRGSAAIALPIAGTTIELNIPLQEGFLLGMTAFSANTGQRGRTFVRATVQRGGAAFTNAVQPLFSDYVTATIPAGWPAGRAIAPTEGPGEITFRTIANPGAGVDWTSGLILGLQSFRIIGAQATLVTSAAAANRIPRLQVRNNAGVALFTGIPNQVVPASTTAIVTYSSAVVPAGANIPDVMTAIPVNALIFPGFTVLSVCAGIQAADQFSNIALWIEEWFNL